MQPATAKTSTKGSVNIRKMLLIASLVLVLLLALFAWWNYYYTYSDGSRYGLLQKFSHRGNLFKTYEGELILSSVKGNQDVTIASEKFYFSVADDGIARQLNDLQGRNIKVHYKEKKKTAFWRGDSRYIVDSVSAMP